MKKYLMMCLLFCIYYSATAQGSVTPTPQGYTNVFSKANFGNWYKPSGCLNIDARIAIVGTSKSNHTHSWLVQFHNLYANKLNFDYYVLSPEQYNDYRQGQSIIEYFDGGMITTQTHMGIIDAQKYSDDDTHLVLLPDHISQVYIVILNVYFGDTGNPTDPRTYAIDNCGKSTGHYIWNEDHKIVFDNNTNAGAVSGQELQQPQLTTPPQTTNYQQSNQSNISIIANTLVNIIQEDAEKTYNADMDRINQHSELGSRDLEASFGPFSTKEAEQLSHFYKAQHSYNYGGGLPHDKNDARSIFDGYYPPRADYVADYDLLKLPAELPDLMYIPTCHCNTGYQFNTKYDDAFYYLRDSRKCAALHYGGSTYNIPVSNKRDNIDQDMALKLLLAATNDAPDGSNKIEVLDYYYAMVWIGYMLNNKAQSLQDLKDGYALLTKVSDSSPNFSSYENQEIQSLQNFVEYFKYLFEQRIEMAKDAGATDENTNTTANGNNTTAPANTGMPADIQSIKQSGWACLNRNDFLGATSFFLTAYQKGDMNSLYWLASSYSNLNNWPMAAKYYKLMVASNSTGTVNYYDCVINLANMYTKGQGVPKSYVKAIELATRTAVTGNRFGMGLLGDIYSDKNYIQKNYQKAIEWYTNAASTVNRSGLPNDAPYVPAMVSIGQFYENGTGVKKDFKKALNWYRKALNESARQQRFTGTDGKEYGYSYKMNPSIEDHIKTVEENLQKGN